MKALLRLFPASWRERYGDEFLAMLEGQRLSARDLADIVRAACSLRLRSAAGGRLSGAALGTAALIWWLIPPALLHPRLIIGAGFDFRLTYAGLLHTGFAVVTLVSLGCIGLRPGRDTCAVRALGLGAISAGWLAYCFAECRYLAGASPLADVWTYWAVLAAFCAFLPGVSLIGLASILAGRAARWLALPLALIPLLGCLDLYLYYRFRYALAPSWSQITYLALWMLPGVVWLGLGSGLWRRPERGRSIPGQTEMS